jgi:hypothetical protein
MHTGFDRILFILTSRLMALTAVAATAHPFRSTGADSACTVVIPLPPNHIGACGQYFDPLQLTSRLDFWRLPACSRRRSAIGADESPLSVC